MASNDGLTLQQSVGDKLGVTLARHAPLRNAVNTLAKALAKAKVIELREERFEYSASDRKRLAIAQADVVCLVNAVLLQGIFSEPRVVIKILTNSCDRAQYAEWARELLLGRQSVAGLGLVRPELLRFLDMLASDALDLTIERLPNPFADALPQMGLGPGKSISLLKMVAAQSASLSLADSMMAHYLDGELEKAYDAALEVQADRPLLTKYKNLIMAEYKEAKSFDDLLDGWR